MPDVEFDLFTGLRVDLMVDLSTLQADTHCVKNMLYNGGLGDTHNLLILKSA
jgi:hypothetical protein